jgi:hypothetical protein
MYSSFFVVSVIALLSVWGLARWSKRQLVALDQVLELPTRFKPRDFQA